MNKKKIVMVIAGFFLFLAVAGISYEEMHNSKPISARNEHSRKESAAVDKIPAGPVEGMITMIDLGATTCIPCKMMAPILEELKKIIKEKQP